MAYKREAATSGFILAISSCVDAACLKGRSHREEPRLSGGSDELSLQLLFIFINFVISTLQHVLLTLIITSKFKNASHVKSPALSTHYGLCSVLHAV